jgi:hypothetical protein
MMRCSRCGADMSAWEVREAERRGATSCWCEGVPPGVSRTLANVAYASLCDTNISKPVKTHDVVRFVVPEYNGNPRYSMPVALSSDKRFCWAGRALYGLARHGLIPGARSLAEAAYAVLLAAPRPLHVEEVDFVLEQLNYRFNADSLLHHLRGYTSNRWQLDFHMDYANRVRVNAGRDARHEYNRCVRVCPTHAGFDAWIEEDLARQVSKALDDRMDRLANLADRTVNVAGDRIEFR